jgi:hypothetical protein
MLFSEYRITTSSEVMKIPTKIEIPIKHKTCATLEDTSPSGFYTFNINNKTYQTYCYKNNNEYWTLIGFYNNTSLFLPKQNITTLNEEGFLSREIWDNIKNEMNELIFAGTTPDSTHAAKLNAVTLYSANCHSFNYFDTTSTERKRIFHDEDLECLGTGTDYTTIELNHPHKLNSVGFWNFSSNSKILEIGTFFKNDSGYQEVQNYDKLYFFIK